MSKPPVAAACGRAVALLVALGLAPALLASATPAAAQVLPTAGPQVVIDGPSADIVGLDGLSVAHDGSGGIVYLKQVLGVPHVFVSRLADGGFQPPEQLDTGLIDASSQPVIAAGNGGVLLVAFINDGQLYVVDRLSATLPWGQPEALASGASNPALRMSPFGKGYLAFTMEGDGGHDVRAAYYYLGSWALEPTPLDANPSDDAGTGSGRPAVAAAGDGVGIVVWGEAGHIYSRRVWGTAPSVVYEQADVPSLSGGTEVSADEPEVAAGDDSSYADVVFHEVVAYGSQDQSRVLMRRLVGSQYDSITQPDGVPAGSAEQADDPEVVMGEFGRGLITMAHTDSDQVFVTRLNTDGEWNGTLRLDSLTNTSGPDAVPAMAGVNTDLVAWQQDPDFGASSEIRVRYSTDSVTFGPELVVSSPALGPTDAAEGLFASGDRPGNAAVAWVQGSGDSTRIVADQLYQPPGSFALEATSRYLRTVHPVLSWSQSGDHWGPIDYTLRIDGVPVAQTGATSMAVPAALGQGPHRWLVTAANPSGLAVSTKLGRFWVDSVPPEVQLSLTGVRRAGKVLHLYVRYTDSPPPVPTRDASGVASVVVRWGDGSSFRIHHRTFHAYLRPGRYRLTVAVEDRAGNKTTIVTTVRIAPAIGKKKPTRRAKHHSGRQR